MEHIVRFERGYDCVTFECVNGSERCQPGTGGSHGRIGLAIRFVAKGDAGAVQFLLWTGWLPQYAPPSNIGARYIREWNAGTLYPADLGIHAKVAQYEGQPFTTDCEYCDGGRCHYDGSSLNASDAMYALVNGGDSALWAFLDAYYDTVFNGAAYPAPAEYERPLRAPVAEQQQGGE